MAIVFFFFQLYVLYTFSVYLLIGCDFFFLYARSYLEAKK